MSRLGHAGILQRGHSLRTRRREEDSICPCGRPHLLRSVVVSRALFIMTQKSKVAKGRSRSEISVRRLHISAIVRAWSQGPSRLLPKFSRSRPLALPTLADNEPDLKILSRQVDSIVEVSEEDTIHTVLERTSRRERRPKRRRLPSGDHGARVRLPSSVTFSIARLTHFRAACVTQARGMSWSKVVAIRQ